MKEYNYSNQCSSNTSSHSCVIYIPRKRVYRKAPLACVCVGLFLLNSSCRVVFPRSVERFQSSLFCPMCREQHAGLLVTTAVANLGQDTSIKSEGGFSGYWQASDRSTKYSEVAALEQHSHLALMMLLMMDGYSQFPAHSDSTA